MADTPIPQNYQTILSNMLDVLTAKTGIKTLKVGNPLLSLLEAAAQSDLRSSQVILDFLRSISLDDASGQALDFIAVSEGTTRIGAISAQGFVNFVDSSFEKSQTVISSAGPLASAGSTTVTVLDTSDFPTSGSLYIGRGTINEEGPISYTSKTDTTFSISPLVLSHAAGETVILSQGGERLVSSGTEVSVLSGIGDKIAFQTINDVVILDGESQVTNVPVLATIPGTNGNVVAQSITEVTSSIPGLTVSNSKATYGGAEIESDYDLRERIRKLRQSRSKGTAASLESGVLGALGPDGQRISSALVVEETNKATLYIDNGKGYEETFESVPYEALTTSAVGGEQYFELNNKPVAQANLISANAAPWIIEPGATLAVIINNTTSRHTFLEEDFKNYNAASAYEVIASINGNDDLLFQAKVVENGTKIALFAKGEYLHRIKFSPEDGDVNGSMNFPLLSVDTLNLYKNKKLLLRDDVKASVISQPQTSWGGAIVDDQNILKIRIDGTPTLTVSWSTEDSVLYGTAAAYLVPTLNLDLWAEWLDSKLPGVRVLVQDGSLVLESISGESLEIDEACDMVEELGIFLGTESTVGLAADYSLNLNTAQIKLVEPLAPGDALEVGTEYPASFIEIGNDWTGSVQLDGHVYFVVDGAVEVLTDLISSETVYDTFPSGNFLNYYRTSGTTPDFRDILNTNEDWLIISKAETGINPTFSRIVLVGQNSFTLEQGPISGASGKKLIDYAFIRTAKIPQKLPIANITYTSQAFADLINANIVGVTALVYKNKVRIYTNNESDDGEIAVVNVHGNPTTGGNNLEDLMAEHIQSNPAQVSSILKSQTDWLGTSFQSRKLLGATNTNKTADLVIKDHVSLEDPFIVDPTAWFYWPFFSEPNNKLKIFPALSEDAGQFSGASSLGEFNEVTSKTAGTYDSENSIADNGIINVKNDYVWVDKFLHSIAQVVPPVAISHDDSLAFIIDNDLTKNYKVEFFKDFTLTSTAWTQSLTASNVTGIADDSLNGHTFFAQARGGSHFSSDLEMNFKHKRYGKEGEATVVSIEPPESEFGVLSGREEIIDGKNYCKVFMPAGLNRNINLDTGRRFHNICLGNFVEDIIKPRNSPNLANSDEFSGTATGNETIVTVTFTGSSSLAYNYKTNDYIFVTEDDGSRLGVKQITWISDASFSYPDTVAAGSRTVAFYFMPIPCGTVVELSSPSVATRQQLVLDLGAPHLEFEVGSTVYISGGKSTTTTDIVDAQLCQVIHNSGNEIVVSITEDFSDDFNIEFVATHYTSRRTIKESHFTIVTGKASKVDSGTYGTVTCTFLQTPAMRTLGLKSGDFLYVTTSATDFETTAASVQVFDVTATSFKYIDSDDTGTIPNDQPIVFKYGISDYSWAGITPATDCYFSDQDHFAVKNGFSSSMPLLPETNGTRVDFYDWGATNGVPTSPSSVNAIKIVEIDYSTVGAVESFINGSTLSVTADYKGTIPATLYTDSTLNECYKKSTNSEFGGNSISVPAFRLFDGENTVDTCDVGVSTTDLELRWPLKSNASGSVAGQVIKVCPNEPLHVANWMNNSGLSALPSVAETTCTDNGVGVQVSRIDIGSGTSLQYSGGSANARVIQAIGNPMVYSDRRFSVQIPKNLTGFTGNQWVKVTNSQNRVVQLGSAVTGAVLDKLNNKVTLTGTFDLRKHNIPIAFPINGNARTTIRTHGDLWCVVFAPQEMDGVNYYLAPNAVPGDKLDFSSDTSGANSYLQGEIVGRDMNTFWVRGNGLETTVASGSPVLTIFKPETLVAGSKIVISGSTLGNSVLTVKRITGGYTGQGKTLEVEGINNDETISSGNCTVLTADDFEMHAKIVGYSYGEEYDSLILETQYLPNTTKSVATNFIAANPNLEVMNKLEFPTAKSVGSDGYRYNTGLLAEANKIVYGDEAKSLSYPGLHASGTVVNISGPLVRRIYMSLSVRLSTANTKDLTASIKNAVAKTINSSYVGQNIAISDVIESVNRIRGVESVVITAPTYNTQNDLIPVKLGEKALILDPETDIDVIINE